MPALSKATSHLFRVNGWIDSCNYCFYTKLSRNWKALDLQSKCLIYGYVMFSAQYIGSNDRINASECCLLFMWEREQYKITYHLAKDK